MICESHEGKDDVLFICLHILTEHNRTGGKSELFKKDTAVGRDHELEHPQGQADNKKPKWTGVRIQIVPIQRVLHVMPRTGCFVAPEDVFI